MGLIHTLSWSIGDSSRGTCLGLKRVCFLPEVNDANKEELLASPLQ